MEKFKFDVVSQTLTVTAKFAAKMNDPESEEYKRVLQFQSDFPNLKIAKRTHKSPRKCTSKSTGEKFRCNQFKNLTCDRMEKFIDALPNNEGYKREFEFVRYTASRIQTNGYKQVREWFVAQFPEFRKNPMFYLNNAPDVVDGAEFLNNEAAAREAEAA